MNKFEVDNRIWQEDIENLANEIIFEEYKNSSILVVGASGLIGSEIVFSLIRANRIKKLNIKVVALVRNEKKAQEKFKNILTDSCFQILIQDVNDKINCDEKIDYIIHCANNTSSMDMLLKPVEVINTTLNGTRNVLEFAKEKKIKSLIYLSSLEVYGIIKKDELIKEDDFGYIDLANPRSSYPESKRLAENLCTAYACEYGIDVKIARLTQTFGAGILKDDNRVFAQFARCASEKKNIILHTKGETIRNYCYITDCVNAILIILKNGLNKEIYNVANEKSGISIYEMANLIAQKNNIKVEFEIDDLNRGYNSTIKACLDSSKLKTLGWQAKVGLDEMYERLIEYLKN